MSKKLYLWYILVSHDDTRELTINAMNKFISEFNEFDFYEAYIKNNFKEIKG